MGGPRMATDGRLAYRRGPAGQAEAGKDVGVAPVGEMHFRSGAGRGKPL